MSIAAAYYRDLTRRELEQRFTKAGTDDWKCKCGAVLATVLASTHKCSPVETRPINLEKTA